MYSVAYTVHILYISCQRRIRYNVCMYLLQLSALSNNTQTVGGFPGLRWAQTAKYGYVPNNRLQNVFMAVAMDLPDFNSPYGA